MALTFLKALDNFWKLHPALFYGIAFLLGSFTSQGWNFSNLAPTTLFFSPAFFLKNFSKKSNILLALSFCLFCCGYFYTKTSTIFPEIAENQEIKGVATFSPNSLRTTFFHGKYWDYVGTANFFKDKSLIAKNIPCKMRIPDKLKRPKGDSCYQFNATLINTGNKRFSLKPDKEAPWKRISKSTSLVELRFEAQNRVSSYIRKEIRNQQTANFLVGIVTGDFQDRLLSHEFSRFGLQHIMAISGFHFAIFASIVGTVLSLALSKKKATLILILLLSIYFIFLGSSPSIARAWLCCMIALFGSLIGSKASGLNSLGIALFFVLLIDPTSINSMGFQFSFATTASILLLYPACDEFLQLLFPKRRLQEGIKMKTITKHGYILLSFLRQAIALDLSVNLIAIPLTLYYFQKVPLLSFVYNLFFPFLVSFSLFFLIVSLGISVFIPQLASLINAWNNIYTTSILEYTHNMPSSIDATFSSATFPAELIVIQCFILLSCGVLYRSYIASREENPSEWSFI